MRYLIGFLGVGVAFLALDFVWLSLMVPRLYRPLLEPLLAPGMNVGAAVAFYLVYTAGVLWVAVLPALSAGSGRQAATTGLALGLTAYATYNLTNQATLKVWPLAITLADTTWGAILTSAAALGGYFAVRLFERS